MDPTSAPKFQIDLLGQFRVLYDSRLMRFQRGSNNGKVFAYLVLHPEEDLARTKVARDLWPDDPEGAGLSWIRDSLYNLRRVACMNDALQVTQDSVRWMPPTSYRLDVAVHNDALVRCRQAMSVGQAPELKHWLQVVEATMQGELLPDFEGPWIDELRDSMHAQQIRVLEDAGSFLWQRQELDAALQITTKLIAVDPLREASYRLRMEILAAAREYSALEDTYRQLSKRLSTELESEPSEATARFYQQSLAAHALPIAPRIAPPAHHNAPLPPIGRQTEWQKLCGLWQSTQKTGNRCVLISGEAGIGKSFLADSFAQHLQNSGAFVLRSRSYADDEIGAFSPIYDWMKDHRLAAAIDRLPVKMQQEIARFHPQLMQRNSALSFPEPAIHPYQRRLLFDSIHAVLNELDAMVVLYMDDMHWLDRETIAWLKHTLRHSRHRHPMLILGTVRTEDLARSGEFHDWMDTLAQRELLTQIALHRLNRRETIELIEATCNIPFSADAKLALFQLTEGNPLCIVEYLRTDLVKREHQSSIPEKIRALAQERLRFLSSHTLDLVCFAAILGRDFDHALLELGLKQDEQDMLNAIEEACRFEIFQPTSETMYRFSHGLVQEAIYESLLPAKRHLLHRRCAAALEQRHREDLRSAAAKIGHHYEHAQRWEDAQRYYIMAGDTELNLGAFVAAGDHYAHAQHLISSFISPENKHPLLAEVLLRRGAVSSLLEPIPQANTTAIYANARRLIKEQGETRLTVAALRGLWETALNSNQIDKARNLAQELWDTVYGIDEPDLLCEAHWTMGNVAFYMGDFACAKRELRACIALAEQTDACSPPATSVFNTHLGALLYLAATAQLCGKSSFSRQLVARAADVVRTSNRLADDVYFQTHRLILAHVVHDIAYGLKHCHNAVALANKSGIPMAIAGCTGMETWFGSVAGRRIHDVADTQRLMIGDEGSTLGSTHFLTVVAQICLAQDQVTQAGEVIAAAQRNLQRSGDAMMASILGLAEAQWLKRTDAPADTVIGAYQHAQQVATTQQAHYLHLQITLDYARYLQARGQTAAAKQMLRQSLNNVDLLEDDHYVKSGLRLLTAD